MKWRRITPPTLADGREGLGEAVEPTADLVELSATSSSTSRRGCRSRATTVGDARPAWVAAVSAAEAPSRWRLCCFS